jgi:tetratricopeptide (TPR) repeat protein/outer membrane protein OmpA-like peptidoglycan-associated protein
MMKNVRTIVFFATLCNNLLAQTPHAFENAAKQAAESKDYYSAMQYYQKVLQIDPNRVDVSYRYADAALEYGAYKQAETYFEKTVAEDNKGLYPDATFQLATTKKSLGKYDEAIDFYQRFINNDKSNVDAKAIARKELEQCEWAMEKLTTPDNSMTIKRLSNAYNTEESEFGAVNINGMMYYSSFRAEDWGDKNFPPRTISKVLQAAEGQNPVPAPFNDVKRHTAHTAFSPDGKVLVFNKCDYTALTSIDCELYFCQLQSDGKWSEPVKLPDFINHPDAQATQPHVVDAAGYYDLYFSSDRPDGKGGFDIWRSRFSKTGNFSLPENLSHVNSVDDDKTPYFDIFSNSLYFSTKGRWTIGGFDIYKAEKTAAGFKEPEHQPFPLNSSFDDLYFAPQGDGSWAYFASNRTGANELDESVCCYDLYKMEWKAINLEASAFNAVTDASLNGVKFTVTEVENGDKSRDKDSGEGNNASFSLLRAKKYRIVATKEHYMPDTSYVTTYTYPTNGEIKSKLFLIPRIDLLVNTFHAWSKDGLNGVDVKLYEIPSVVSEQKNTGDDNSSEHMVGGKRQFTIVAEKEGYLSDTLYVGEDELKDILAGSKIKRELFLAPASMSEYLPITLYFDNDQPDARTKATTTQLSYDQTVERYLARRELFIQTYTQGLEGEEKERAAKQLAQFFDVEITAGRTKLDVFTSNLDLFLRGGSSIEIMIKSFASPLANSDYNMALTQRRIASVRNYLRKYGNGIFEQYVRSGKLKVSMLPLGETLAPSTLSDSPTDKKRSVFSIDASKERRAEILEVRLFKN